MGKKGFIEQLFIVAVIVMGVAKVVTSQGVKTKIDCYQVKQFDEKCEELKSKKSDALVVQHIDEDGVLRMRYNYKLENAVDSTIDNVDKAIESIKKYKIIKVESPDKIQELENEFLQGEE